MKAAGCELIRAEKMSGTRREGRAELELLLEFVRPGDELVITRIDRLNQRKVTKLLLQHAAASA